MPQKTFPENRGKKLGRETETLRSDCPVENQMGHGEDLEKEKTQDGACIRDHCVH